MTRTYDKLWENLAECTLKNPCNNCINFANTELFKSILNLSDCYECHKRWGMEVIKKNESEE